ncbi:hypothetical protein DES49_1764 [Halospina denitrificans]|uniref:Uncharacterized protein n=2 Tax=Halospina denitrificans TaxID=332522 RepID=A0A4R7JTK1_9GAMM|nr:hypothetical protein DES49_1764 [Halospina denitrificans]
MLVCTNCRQGLMDPIRDDEEPEYTDRYQCGHCGHIATIPSVLIVTSQIISALLGGGITVYLLVLHGGNMLQLWQYGGEGSLLHEGGLAVAALLLLGGFLYIMVRAASGIALRVRYRQPQGSS